MRLAGLATPAALALVLLAGCAPKGAGNVAAANAAPPPQDVVITAAQLPTFKPGSWQETETANGGLPETNLTCESGKPLDVSDFGEGCGTQVFKKTADGGYSIDVSCARDAAMKTMHLTIKGDFNAAYTADAVVTTAEPGKPTQTETHHLSAKYVGPCASESPDANAAG